MTERIIRNTLWMSVPFNLIAAYLLLMPHSVAGALVGMPAETPLFYRALMCLVIAFFGGIYAWLATRTPINIPVLAIGALGKLSVFSTIFLLWLTGEAAGGITLLASGDLIFGSMWATWLFQTHNKD